MNLIMLNDIEYYRSVPIADVVKHGEFKIYKLERVAMGPVTTLVRVRSKSEIGAVEILMLNEDVPKYFAPDSHAVFIEAYKVQSTGYYLVRRVIPRAEWPTDWPSND